MARVGLQCNALYFVRPDGYIALATAEDRASVLNSYLKAHNILPINRGS
jgi:hypothetical protein